MGMGQGRDKGKGGGGEGEDVGCWGKGRQREGMVENRVQGGECRGEDGEQGMRGNGVWGEGRLVG